METEEIQQKLICLARLRLSQTQGQHLRFILWLRRLQTHTLTDPRGNRDGYTLVLEPPFLGPPTSKNQTLSEARASLYICQLIFSWPITEDETNPDLSKKKKRNISNLHVEKLMSAALQVNGCEIRSLLRCKNFFLLKLFVSSANSTSASMLKLFPNSIIKTGAPQTQASKSSCFCSKDIPRKTQNLLKSKETLKNLVHKISNEAAFLWGSVKGCKFQVWMFIQSSTSKADQRLKWCFKMMFFQ